LNQVVIWDKIIKTKKQAKLSEKNEFVKYALIDQGAELRWAHSSLICQRNLFTEYNKLLCFDCSRGKSVTLKLMWDHMPITGPMYFENAGNGTFKLPSKYKM
jgi:signal peptidase complex subunit 3